MKHRLLVLFVLLLWPTTSSAQVSALPSFADLVEQLSPSVVNISTTPKDDTRESHSELLNGTIGDSDILSASPSTHVALGSGFILDEEGYILTNGHVIENASEITVILHDNTPLAAVLVGTDKKTDLALIKVDTNHKLTPVKFGDSDKIRVGDWILAIGNPFGLGGSVTAGIVSAKSRDIASGPYDNFIQTDASINQGSSGGPMFNLQGEVIGINTAIFSTTGGSMGIGFAIPANQAHFVIKQLKEHGKVTRGWIGIKIQPHADDIAKSLDLKGKPGIIISGVTEGSPAKQVGIEAGDIMLSVNNQPTGNTQSFSRLIAESPIGSEIAVSLWRNGQILNKRIKILPMPEPRLEAQPRQHAISAENPTTVTLLNFAEIGIGLANIDEQMLDKYQLPSATKGLVVTDILPGSDAENKGLKRGSVIIKIDKKDVFNLEDAKRCIDDAELENRRPVLLSVLDADNSMYFVAVKFVEEE